MAYGYYGNQSYINPYMQPYQPAQNIPQNIQQNMQNIPPINQNIPQMKPDNGIIWVQGEAAAKSYLVAPNNTVVLWDSENPYIYVKSADTSGMPNTRKFELIEKTEGIKIEPPKDNINFDEFVNKKDFENLKNEFNNLMIQFESINKPKSKKKEENINE